MADPLISFGGIASGLDTQSIIAALVGVRRRPISILQGRQSQFERLKTRYDSLKGKLEAFQNAADDLRRSSDFLSFTAAVSNDTVLNATPDGSAAPGSFSVVVSALAKAESEGSAGFADFDTTNLGTGTLKITVGGIEHDVVINSGEDTLEGIRNAIIDAKIGVTATVVNEGTGASPYRLVVTSKETGAANSISFSDDLGGSGLAAALNFSNLVAGSDAVATVNGLSITRSTNSIDDVVPGVSLDLLSVGSSTVTVSSNVADIKAKVKAYVGVHSDLMSFINSEIKVSELTDNAGVFNGEATVRRIKNEILSQYGQASYPGGTLTTLGQVGLSLQRDGTLSFDEAKFDEAADENLDGLAALFTKVGDTIDGTGFSIYDVPDELAAGTYAVNVTQAATRAGAAASQAFAVGGLTADEMLTITLGSNSVDVQLSAGDSLADAVSKINNALNSAGIDVSASDDSGVLTFAADSYGSAGSFSIVSDTVVGAGSTGVGTTSLAAIGLDIQGTINGEAATGEGQYLTGDTGTTVEDVRLRYIGTTTTSANLTVGPDGFFVKMEGLLDNFLKPISGAVAARLDGLEESIRKIDDRIETMDDRVEQYREMLVKKFASLEAVIGRLQSQQSFLSTFQFPNFTKSR
ncbi:MAG: flagellar filament capping protein FliD [Planctomycetota bacterium]